MLLSFMPASPKITRTGLFDQCPPRKGTGSLKWDRFDDPPEVLPMWVADMDFPAAPEILEALHQRVDHGVMGYTIPYASVEEAVVEYQYQRHQRVITRNDLVWLPGLVFGLNLLCKAFGSREGGVMTTLPVYPPFISAPANAGIPVHTMAFHQEGKDWRLDFDQLEAILAEKKPELFFLCHPYNPLGKVFSREELGRLIELMLRYEVILVSDEIHCDLILDPKAEWVPLSETFPEIKSQLISLHSPSKTYNLPGLSCAYAVVADPALRLRLQKAGSGLINEINVMGYAGCEAAYRLGGSWKDALQDKLRSHVKMMSDRIPFHLDKDWIAPQATYLTWIRVSSWPIENPHASALKAGVRLTPGADYGDPAYLRLNFGCPTDRLEEGLGRLEAMLESR